MKALQQDLRRLGYLKSGIDGQFGEGSDKRRPVAAALACLPTPSPTAATVMRPQPLKAFNRGRVASVTGVCDQGLVVCIEDMLADHRLPTLPRSDDPARANRDAFAALQTLVGLRVPRPFLLAILLQESDGQHFRTPTGANADDFIVVGLDRNDQGHPRPHHLARVRHRAVHRCGSTTPPRADEVASFMLDPVRQRPAGGRRAEREIRDLRQRTNAGATGGRSAGRGGSGALRRCRYGPDDARYMLDCVRCAAESRVNIGTTTPLHPKTTETLQPTPAPTPEIESYRNVPDRAKLALAIGLKRGPVATTAPAVNSRPLPVPGSPATDAARDRAPEPRLEASERFAERSPSGM